MDTFFNRIDRPECFRNGSFPQWFPLRKHNTKRVWSTKRQLFALWTKINRSSIFSNEKNNLKMRLKHSNEHHNQVKLLVKKIYFQIQNAKKFPLNPLVKIFVSRIVHFPNLFFPVFPSKKAKKFCYKKSFILSIKIWFIKNLFMSYNKFCSRLHPKMIEDGCTLRAPTVIHRLT